MTPPRTRTLAACPACLAAGDGTQLFESGDRQHGTPGVFRYCICPRCASVFQNPQVIEEDRANTYPSCYYTHTDPSLPREPGALRGPRNHMRNWIFAYHYGTGRLLTRLAGGLLYRVPFLRRRAFFGLIDELIPPRSRGEKALDVGCGSGKILRALRLAGWDAEGVEWDENAANVAVSHADCAVHIGGLFGSALVSASYKLVLLSHVFEHLDDPVRALARVRELLAPEGRAVLIYPNSAGLGARHFKEHWFPWEVPRHLVFVHPSEMYATARSAGLEVTALRTLHRSAAGVSALSRAYQSGRVLKAQDISVTVGDHAFMIRERLRMLYRPTAGEEVLVVLRANRAKA